MGRSSFLSFREYVGRKVENLFHVKGRASTHDHDLIENIDKSWSGRGRNGRPLHYTGPYMYSIDDNESVDLNKESDTVDDDDWREEHMDGEGSGGSMLVTEEKERPHQLEFDPSLATNFFESSARGHGDSISSSDARKRYSSDRSSIQAILSPVVDEDRAVSHHDAVDTDGTSCADGRDDLTPLNDTDAGLYDECGQQQPEMEWSKTFVRRWVAVKKQARHDLLRHQHASHQSFHSDATGRSPVDEIPELLVNEMPEHRRTQRSATLCHNPESLSSLLLQDEVM